MNRQLRKSYESEKSSTGWVQTRLGDVLTLTSDPVTVDTSSQYPNLGIYSFGRGLFEKQPIIGISTIAPTLFRVKANQFIYSRLFAFEGAYGVVPTYLSGHYVSNEYPTFDCDTKRLLPTFIEAYFKNPQLWKVIAVGSKGLGDRRQRVHPTQILAHTLWLPPLEWQNKLNQVSTKLSSQSEQFAKSLKEMTALTGSILDRAFRGGL